LLAAATSTLRMSIAQRTNATSFGSRSNTCASPGDWRYETIKSQSAAAAIRIAHVGPPRGLVACSVELLCLAFILISFSVRLALRRAPQRRVSGAQWSRRSCRRSVAYLPMSSAEMCGISLSGPALTASTSARNASVGAAAPRIGLSGLRKASNRGRTEC